MSIWRILLGSDIVGNEDDDDCVVTKGIYADSQNAAQQAAERIANREGISGKADIQECSDVSGGSYYRVTWRK